jgi:hypothetical protein
MRYFDIRWQWFSFAPIAIPVYALVATLQALAVVNPLVVQDEYVYFVTGLNFVNLDFLYTNTPTMVRTTNYIYLALINIVGRLTAAPDTALKVFQIASICLSAWVVTTLIKTKLGDSLSKPFDSIPAFLLLFLLLWPSNTFGVFVMPDILYFDVFLIGFSLVVSKIRSWEWQVAAFGCIAGLLFHIKPHALFLFISLLCAIVGMKLIWWSTISVISLLRASILACVCFGSVVALTKIFFMLTIKLPESNLIGTFYSNYLSNSMVLLYLAIPNLVRPLINFVLGSLTVVGPCLIYIVWILSRAAGSSRRAQMSGLPAYLAFPSLLCVICWFILVVGITIVVFADPNEDHARIHLRYVAFTFPAFFISALLLFMWVRKRVQEGATEWAEPPILKWAMAMTWSIPAMYFVWRVDKLSLYYSDAPDLFSMYSGHIHLTHAVFGSNMKWVSASLILVASGWIVLRPHTWVKTYLFTSIILFFFATLNLAGSNEKSPRRTANSGYLETSPHLFVQTRKRLRFLQSTKC